MFCSARGILHRGILQCLGCPAVLTAPLWGISQYSTCPTVLRASRIGTSSNAQCDLQYSKPHSGASCNTQGILQCSMSCCAQDVLHPGIMQCLGHLAVQLPPGVPFWGREAGLGTVLVGSMCAGTTLGLVCRAVRPDVSQMLYSLPVWLLHVRLFMYLFVLDYKQNKKGFYNPAPRRLRVQDVICRLFTIVWLRLPAPCAVPGHALLCYGDFFPHDVFSQGMFSFLPPSGAQGGNISRLLWAGGGRRRKSHGFLARCH